MRLSKPPHSDDFGDPPTSAVTRHVHHEVHRQRDGLANALVGKAHVGRQDAVGQARQCLFGGVRVDGGQTAQVAGVERLQQVERFAAAHLTHQDPIGPVPQGGAHEIGDGDGREGRLLTERSLRATRLEPNQVRLVQVNLRGLLDHHDAVLARDPGGQRVQQRRLAAARPTRDEDVPLA